MPSYILAHDIGTSGNKAALFDEHGALVSSTTVPYATYIADSVCIEQSAEDWWKAVSLATKQVLQGIAPCSGHWSIWANDCMPTSRSVR